MKVSAIQMVSGTSVATNMITAQELLREARWDQLPLELALLPVIESAYNPLAYSRAHAADREGHAAEILACVRPVELATRPLSQAVRGRDECREKCRRQKSLQQGHDCTPLLETGWETWRRL